MDLKSIKKILKTEYSFFDDKYFETRNDAGFKWNFSCHGFKNYIPLSSGSDMGYDTLIDEICYASGFRAKNLETTK